MPIKALPLCPNWDWRECACMNVHSPKVYLWELRHQLLKNRMRREKVTWQFSSYIDSAFLLHVILLSKQWMSIILNNNVYKWHSDQSEVTKIKERDDEDGKRKRKRVVGVMVGGGGGGGENIIKKKQSKKPIWTVAYVSLTCHWWQTCCPMPFLISILKKTVTNLYFCTKCTYEPQTPVNQNVAITTHWSKCGYHNSLVKMWLSLLTGQNVAITTHWSKCGYHNSLVKMWLSQLTGQNVAITTHLSKCGYHNSPVKTRLSQLTGQNVASATHCFNVAITTHLSRHGYHNSSVKTRLSRLTCQDTAGLRRAFNQDFQLLQVVPGLLQLLKQKDDILPNARSWGDAPKCLSLQQDVGLAGEWVSRERLVRLHLHDDSVGMKPARRWICEHAWHELWVGAMLIHFCYFPSRILLSACHNIRGTFWASYVVSLLILLLLLLLFLGRLTVIS